MGLLDFHADHGFAGCSEALLRRLCQHMGWTATRSRAGMDAGHQLAVAAMLNMDNTLVEEEVVHRILGRHETDKWMPEVEDKDLEAVVRDTLLVGEQDEALRELSKRRSTVSAKALRPKVATMYKQAIQDLEKDFWKAGQEARRKKTQAAEKDGKKQKTQYDRVYNKLSATVDEKVKGMVPGNVHIWTDPKNGRWKVSYKTDVVKITRSISWTQVGENVAGKACVTQAWAWVEHHEGREPPGNLEERLSISFRS